MENNRITKYEKVQLISARAKQIGEGAVSMVETEGITDAIEIANKEFNSATVCIGYADGINRALGNGMVSFRVSGYSLRTVGNICMDMLMLKIPSKIKIREGSDVILFETQEDIIRIAKTVGTIPYEILTSISDRVPKVFVKD